MSRMILTTVILAALATGCSLFNGQEHGDLGEYLKSEQNVLKKRAASLERENAVLERENALVKEEIDSCRDREESLRTDVESWKGKYAADTGQMQERIEQVLSEKQLVETTCMERVGEMTSLLENTRIQLQTETGALRQQMTRQKEAFDQERTQLKTNYSSREKTFQKKIETLQGEIASRDGTIEDLKAEVKKIDALQSQIASRDETIQALKTEVKKIQTLQGEIASRDETIQALKTQVEKLSSRLEEATRTPPEKNPSPADREALRTESIQPEQKGGNAGNGHAATK
jgi:chromosome segregation ATPase